MALVGFQQDPQGPPGAGMFHSDGGESAYLFDPDLAASLSRPSDPRLALNDAGPSDAGVSDAAPNYAPEAAPGGSPVPAPAPPPAQPAPPPQAAPPPAQAGQPAPPQGQPAQAQPVDPDEQARAEQQAYVNSPEYHAPVKAGYKPKTAEVTSEGAEAPLTKEDWQALNKVNQGIEQAQVTHANLLYARANQQVAQAQAQLPKLQQEYAQRQAEFDQKRAEAKNDLAKVNGMLQDINAKKVDHNHFFKDKGMLGNIGAVIAQAFGAYGAALTHSPNFAKEIIDDAINRDIAEQKEEIENGRAGANNMLQMLRDRYNYDIPQAESALKIAQLGVVNAQAQQYQGLQLRQDAQDGLNQWLAQNQKSQFEEARKLYVASMGKQKRTESLTFTPGSAGGTTAPSHKTRMDRLAEIKAAQETGTLVKPGGEPEKNREDAKDLVKTEKEEVAAQTELKSMREIAQKYAGQDIPGWGASASLRANPPIPFALPDEQQKIGQKFLLSQEERENRAAIKRAMGGLIKARYGNAIERNPEFYKEKQAEFEGIQNADDLRKLLDEYDTGIEERRKSIRAGYDPTVVRTVDKRGAYHPTPSIPGATRIGGAQ